MIDNGSAAGASKVVNNAGSGMPEGWSAEYFAVHPEPPRPLTPAELQRLHRNGFPRLALDLAAGTCKCGLNMRSATHRALCEKPEPLEAKPEPRQPWEPRASRKAA